MRVRFSCWLIFMLYCSWVLRHDTFLLTQFCKIQLVLQTQLIKEIPLVSFFFSRGQAAFI